MLSYDFFATLPSMDICFLKGGSNWESNISTIRGYGSWFWKSCNPITTRKKEGTYGLRVVEEKE